MSLHELVTAFLLLALTKALIEPAATAFGRRNIKRYGPTVYRYLDKVIPGIFGKLSGPELEAKFYEDIERLTGEEFNEAWRPTRKEMEILMREYDVRKNADNILETNTNS